MSTLELRISGCLGNTSSPLLVLALQLQRRHWHREVFCRRGAQLTLESEHPCAQTAARPLPCVRGIHLLQMSCDCFWCKMSLLALMALCLSIFKWEHAWEQPALRIYVPKGETWALLWSCCSLLCQPAISSADGEYYLDLALFIPWWPDAKEDPRLALSLLKILHSYFFFPVVWIL